jgi:hypothetical protein
MTKTRRRKWWSIGNKSSFCKIDLFCSCRLKFHESEVLSSSYSTWTSLLIASQTLELLPRVRQMFHFDPFVEFCRLVCICNPRHPFPGCAINHYHPSFPLKTNISSFLETSVLIIILLTLSCTAVAMCVRFFK